MSREMKQASARHSAALGESCLLDMRAFLITIKHHCCERRSAAVHKGHGNGKQDIDRSFRLSMKFGDNCWILLLRDLNGTIGILQLLRTELYGKKNPSYLHLEIKERRAPAETGVSDSPGSIASSRANALMRCIDLLHQMPTYV
jgi:hypothetical protein